MPESPEDRRRALLSIDHSHMVDMYIAESALVDKVTGERDRARDLAVREGVFGGRVLTTGIELDNLEPGSVVLDGDGDAWLRVERPGFELGWRCATSDYHDSSGVPLAYGGSVTVIHEPGERLGGRPEQWQAADELSALDLDGAS